MAIADLTVSLAQDASKESAVITDSVVAPLAAGISIGFTGVDNQRGVEINDGIKRLTQRFIDAAEYIDGVAQLAELPVGGAVSEVVLTSGGGAPSSGNLYLAIGDGYDYALGTVGIMTDVTVALKALIEYLKGF